MTSPHLPSTPNTETTARTPSGSPAWPRLPARVLLGLAAASPFACGNDLPRGSDEAPLSSVQRAAVTPLSPANGQAFRLRQAQSGKYLDIADGSADNAARVVQADGNGGDSQVWKMVAAKGVPGAYELINQHSGRCLDVPGSSQSPGMVVQQYDCDGQTNQKNQLWWPGLQGDGSYFLVGVNAGLQLEVKDANLTAGAAVVQSWTQNGHLQAWRLEAATGDQTAAAPAASAPGPQPAAPAAQASAPTNDAAQATLVRSYIVKLMNQPRPVPGYNETRGGPGNFEKLPSNVVDEYVAAIAACANRFLPSSLPFEARAALLASDISAESAFEVGTAGMNPNPAYGMSVGVQQVTPSIWVPQFQKRAKIDGLKHYNGSTWNPQDTTMDMPATSIWDNMHIANWAISEQAKAGAGNPMAQAFGEDTGSRPHSWWTGLYCWVSGYPACRSNGDVEQSSHYHAMHVADLQLLGFDASLLNTCY